MRALLFFILFLSNSLLADVVFDPYIGTPFGTAKLEDQIESDISGLGIGGRVYYEYFNFFGGIDLKLSANNADSPDRDYEQNQLGLLGGVQFPFAPIRVWTSFYFLDVMSVSPSGYDYKGGGYAFGLGFSPLPFMSINMEYKGSTYDEVEKPAGDEMLTNEAELSSLFISLSFLFRSSVI